MNFWKLLGVLAVVAVLFTKGMPWVMRQIEQKNDRAPVADSPAGRCVDAVENARDLLDREIGVLARSSLDTAAWDEAALRLSDEVDDALRTCNCPQRSCDLARQSAEEMRSGVLAEGGATGANTLALERADDLLDQARRLARNNG